MTPPAWEVTQEAGGERVDHALATHTATPRAKVQKWIRAGSVTVDGRRAKNAQRLEPGQLVAWEDPPPRQETRVAPEVGPLEVILERPDFAVLDKPAGLAVHPGAGRTRGTLAHRLLARYPETAGVGGPGRPGIVHRLDRDTTGALLIARAPAAYEALSRAFAERTVEKIYLAVVFGDLAAPLTLEQPIGRSPRDRKRMAVAASGRPARTDVRSVARAPGVSLVEARPFTGRTHQIRVHLKAAGHPILGDPVYGENRVRDLAAGPRRAARAFRRPALHAWRLIFPAPGGERLTAEAPLPDDMRALWQALGGTQPPL